jgi:hypothetical protein
MTVNRKRSPGANVKPNGANVCMAVQMPNFTFLGFLRVHGGSQERPDRGSGKSSDDYVRYGSGRRYFECTQKACDGEISRYLSFWSGGVI